MGLHETVARAELEVLLAHADVWETERAKRVSLRPGGLGQDQAPRVRGLSALGNGEDPRDDRGEALPGQDRPSGCGLRAAPSPPAIACRTKPRRLSTEG